MLLYNSMTNRKEEFAPEGASVKIYACGPTVYDYFHIGNGRSFLIFDTLRRYLEFKGYQVEFVQNFTDVDDKMINRANQENISISQLAERFISEYYHDADGLNIKRATVNPRATENIDHIIEMISTLIEKGHAYPSDGSVYFRVRSFQEYGKLFKQSIEDLEAGARVNVDEKKEDALDFALWKKTKPGEPYWESPWGLGRPGWHIECSVMAKQFLGNTIDIHCGGNDLKFPHHENEIAQSECANGCLFSKFWFHVGFVNINNEKMSKSKNNFFTVRDLSSVYGYEPLRYFAISAHYRNPINYEPDIIEQAKASLERLYNCADNLDYLAENAISEDRGEKILENFDVYRSKFTEAMDDDLNTANALSVLFDFAKEINITVSDASYTKEFYQKLKEKFVSLCRVLGLLYNQGKSSIDEEIESLIAQRQAARKEKNFQKADQIRDQLKDMGIMLEDTPTGVKWKKA